MTESEMLDRRIEKLVVATVARELDRRGMPVRDTSSKLDLGTMGDDELEERVETLSMPRSNNGSLTETVLLEALRRNQRRAGEYAREAHHLRGEAQDAQKLAEELQLKLNSYTQRIAELAKTCVRLVDERDLAARYRDDAVKEVERLRKLAASRPPSSLAKETRD